MTSTLCPASSDDVQRDKTVTAPERLAGPPSTGSLNAPQIPAIHGFTIAARNFIESSCDLRRGSTIRTEPEIVTTDIPSAINRGTGDPAAITLVVSPGCHFCADADKALAEIASEYPLSVTRIDLRSPEGMELVQRHGAAMSPLVLLDATFVSAGRLPRGKLRSLLSKRQARTQAAAS